MARMGSKGKIRYTAVAPAQELTERFVQTGEPASLEDLVRRYSALIYSVSYRITQDRHDAEDATQIAFLHLAIALKSGKKIEKPVGWLEAVVKRQSLRILRSKSRVRRRERKVSRTEAHNATPISMDAMDEQTKAGLVRDAVDTLPEGYRMPLVLHYFGGMSLEAIAAQMGSNSRTIATRLHRGRKLLSEKLNAMGLKLKPEMLGALLMVVVPTAIARSIIESVSLSAAVPSGLAGSIMHAVSVAAGAAVRHKLIIGAMLVSFAGGGVGLARTLGGFTLPEINLRPVIKWFEQRLEPQMIPLPRVEGAVPRDVDWEQGDPFPRFSFGDVATATLTASEVVRPVKPTRGATEPIQAQGIAPSASRTPEITAPGNFAPLTGMPRVKIPPSTETLAAATPKNEILPEKQADQPRRESVALQPAEASTDAAMLSVGTAGVDLSGSRKSLAIPPISEGGRKLRGFGHVQIADRFQQNGRVVADGAGANRELDLTHTPPVRNTVDNPPDGSNGWYAVDGGKLTLPSLRVDAPGVDYTWGEDRSDPTLDLINSVRLNVDGLHRGGDVSVSLLTLAGNQDEFDSLPNGWGVVGLWKIDTGTLEADAMNLLVRYNHIAAGFLPMGDELLTFLTYSDGGWRATDFAQIGVDPAQHLIAGRFEDAFSYFAVAGPLNPEMFLTAEAPLSSIVPEPGMGMLIALAMPVLMRRRSRQ